MSNAIHRRLFEAARIAALGLASLVLAHCAGPSAVNLAPYRPAPATAFVVPVHEGDTLSEIAERYRVNSEDIMAMNDISNPDMLMAGDRIYVPAYGRPHAVPAAPVTSAPTPVPVPTYRRASYRPNDVPTPIPAPREQARRSPARPALASIRSPAARGPVRFVWPVRGPVLSKFGPGAHGARNDGINIATPSGTPVHAADAGVVTYVGNELRGYGNLLLIRHDNGYVTAYAHNDRIIVKRGQRVQRGQVVSYTGATGDVQRPQLHFEIRHDTQPVNPIAYLGHAPDTDQASLTPSSPARS